MDGVEKNIQLAKETKVLEGLVKLSKASSQEIQRLQGKWAFFKFDIISVMVFVFNQLNNS